MLATLLPLAVSAPQSFLLFGVLLAISGALTLGWILTLIHAAQTERWVWFVIMLVFGLASLLYLVTEYETPKALRARRLAHE